MEWFKEVELLCSTLPLAAELWYATGKAVYTYADKHMPAGLAGVEALSASSPGEAGLGLAYSLWSNDGGGSESHSMSFTQSDLRGPRVKKGR